MNIKEAVYIIWNDGKLYGQEGESLLLFAEMQQIIKQAVKTKIKKRLSVISVKQLTEGNALNLEKEVLKRYTNE